MACEEKAASALVKPSSSKLGSWFEEATLLKLEVVNQDHAHICHMNTRKQCVYTPMQNYACISIRIYHSYSFISSVRLLEPVWWDPLGASVVSFVSLVLRCGDHSTSLAKFGWGASRTCALLSVTNHWTRMSDSAENATRRYTNCVLSIDVR